MAVALGKQEMTADVSRTARPFFEKKGFVVLKENQNLIRGVTVDEKNPAIAAE